MRIEKTSFRWWSNCHYVGLLIRVESSLSDLEIWGRTAMVDMKLLWIHIVLPSRHHRSTTLIYEGGPSLPSSTLNFAARVFILNRKAQFASSFLSNALIDALP